MKTALLPFQVDAVDKISSRIDLLLSEQVMLGKDRKNVSVLLHAPTGSGKTLMATRAINKITERREVVWFWFAPYKSLITQTEKTILQESSMLRVRDINNERQPESISSGDIYVMTWALATNKTSNINSSSESNLSLKEMISRIKNKGFEIGFIADEAHHSIKDNNKSGEIYSSIIRPDMSLFISATPKVDEIKLLNKDDREFSEENIVKIRRIEAVSAGLIKEDIRSYIIESKNAGDTSVKKLTVKLAIPQHYKIKSELKKMGINLSPLLMIQLDNKNNKEEIDHNTVIEWLSESFSEDQIRVHTSEEPSESIINDAANPDIEVLIFKMSAATGFDAPRAFTLVSLRPVNDKDFGTQIIGRLMRVDRKLQKIKNLPSILRHGHVFLSGVNQDGFKMAIKEISEISTVSIGRIEEADSYEKNIEIIEHTHVMNIEDNSIKNHQNETISKYQNSSENNNLAHIKFEQQESKSREFSIREIIPYSLKTAKPLIVGQPPQIEINAAKRFIEKIENLENDLIIDYKQRTKLELSEEGYKESFIKYTEDRKDTIKKSERIIDGLCYDFHSINKSKLISYIKHEIRLRLADKTSREIEDIYNSTIVKHYSILKGEIRKEIIQSQVSDFAAPIPRKIIAPKDSQISSKGAYGVIHDSSGQDGFNNWEREMAIRLDSSENVIWWLRNIPKQNWAVAIHTEEGLFYPDFIVAVKGRNTENNIILLETKNEINDSENKTEAKTRVVHPSYGKPMIVRWNKNENKWKIVVNKDGINTENEEWSPSKMVDWGINE